MFHPYELSESSFASIEQMILNYGFQLRVASPAIVIDFDALTQTITAQPTIDEFLTSSDDIHATVQTALPILYKVPIYMFGTLGFSITAPISAGDECLLVFTDCSIENWFLTGKTNSIPLHNIRHSVDNCFALVGIRSKPNALSGYDTDGIAIRNEDGTTKVLVTDDTISIFVNETIIEVKGTEINIDCSGTANIKSSGTMTIESTGTVNVKGNEIKLADGTVGVARVGDAVSVNPSTHVGTITAGSSKVKAG